jgi:hypothetical protein
MIDIDDSGVVLMNRIRRSVLATIPTTALLVGALALSLGAGSAVVAQPPPVVAAPSVQLVAEGSASTAARAAAAPFAKLSPSQIKKRSIALARKASSYHAVGYSTFSKVRYDFDLVLGRNSSVGGLAWPQKGIGVVSAGFVRIGAAIYLQPDANLWKYYGASDPAAVDGTWIQLRQGGAVYNSIAAWTTFNALLADLERQPVTQRIKGITLGGTPTVGLHQPGKHGGTIYVAASGPAYPRYAVWTDKTNKFALLDWNAPVNAEAPPADKVVAE